MAEKKKTGSAGTKKKTSAAPAKRKTAASRGSTAKTTRSAAGSAASQKQSEPRSNHLRAVGLIALGVLAALFSFVPGTKAWMNIQNVLRGLFGIGTLFLPVILIYTGWMISKEKRVQASGSNFWAILLVLCLSSFV